MKALCMQYQTAKHTKREKKSLLVFQESNNDGQPTIYFQFARCHILFLSIPKQLNPRFISQYQLNQDK